MAIRVEAEKDLSRTCLGAALRGEGDLAQALASGCFHHGDHGLVCGVGVGTDDDHAVLASLGRIDQRGPQTFDAAAFHQRFVDHVAPIDADGDDHFLGVVTLLIGIGGRQLERGKKQ